MVRPNLIDLNPVEFTYYPFMISLDKCSGSYSSNQKWNNDKCQCECNN